MLPAYCHVIDSADEDCCLIDRETKDRSLQYRHNFKPLDITATFKKVALNTLDNDCTTVARTKWVDNIESQNRLYFQTL